MNSEYDGPPDDFDEECQLLGAGAQFGYVPDGDGVIRAVVEWHELDGRIAVVIASADPAIAQFLRDITASPHLEDWVDMARHIEGTLRLFEDFLDFADSLYRIDDNRAGHNRAYMVWLGSKAPEGFSLVPRTIYHYFDPEDGAGGPALTDTGAVVALLHDPDALIVKSVGELGGVWMHEDPRILQQWDLRNRVVIWDLIAIHHATDD